MATRPMATDRAVLLSGTAGQNILNFDVARRNGDADAWDESTGEGNIWAYNNFCSTDLRRKDGVPDLRTPSQSNEVGPRFSPYPSRAQSTECAFVYPIW